MNAPPALDTRSSSRTSPLLADDELGLATLLDLLSREESAEVGTSARSSFRSDGTRLRAWAQGWIRRATAWGAGPGGAWRAW